MSLRWAIKNCGLMLLNALLRRVNGGGDPSSLRVSSSRRQGSPLVYKRYPVLADLVLKLLMQISPEKQLGASDTQTIFAALEIIERFGLPRSSREEALDALRIHIASRFWSIREKAAKAMSFTVDLTVLIQEADHLINHHWSSQNELHGRLLCTRFILKRMDSKNLQLGSGRPSGPIVILSIVADYSQISFCNSRVSWKMPWKEPLNLMFVK